MKVLCINGSPHEHGCTDRALAEVMTVLQREGIETELLYLGTKPIAGCIACNSCMKTGQCVFSDAVNDVVAKLPEYDGILIGSPVYFASAAGQLCAFLDRLFYSFKPRMAGKIGASLVCCRRGGASAALDRLNKYFTISNMAVVGSQYWNIVHGETPEELLADEEGMQNLRTLGQNMAYLLQCREAGTQAGVAAPVYEKRRKTNFVR